MVLVIGHRGARDLWPENSLGGFRNLVALGADGVEFDVQLTADGEAVVMHDPTVDRTTDGSGPVGALTLAELQGLTLKGSLGEPPPALEAVLATLAPSPLELHIELKTDHLGRLPDRLIDRTLELVREHELEDRSVVTCFLPEVLERVRRRSGSVRLLGSFDRRSAEMMGGVEAGLRRFTELGAMVAVEKSLLAHSFDACADTVGAERLGAWTPNTAPELDHWIRQPIRAITTDRPDLALALRAAQKSAQESRLP